MSYQRRFAADSWNSQRWQQPQEAWTAPASQGTQDWKLEENWWDRRWEDQRDGEDASMSAGWEQSRWQDWSSDSGEKGWQQQGEDSEGGWCWEDGGSTGSSVGWNDEEDWGSSSWWKGDDSMDVEGDQYWRQQVTFHDIVLSPGGDETADGQRPARPSYVLLFFHSSCHGPEDVLQYVPYLWDAGLRPCDVRIRAPCSPLRDLKGWSMNSWYEYATDHCWKGSTEDRVVWDQFMQQRQRLLSILEEEHARLPPGGKLVLGGLSQGASLALDVLLHAPAHIDSIVGCFCSRGMMQQETLWNLPRERVRQRASSCPIFVYHGKNDSTVPWHLAKRSYRWLEDSGFNISTLAERHVNHGTTSMQEYQRVGGFVAGRFWSNWNL